MKTIVLPLVMLMGSSTMAFAAPQCPQEIKVSQSLAAPVAEWTGFQTTSPTRLSGIAFYDGPPAEDASLAPDSFKKQKSLETAIWTFDPQSSRSIWMMCLYAGTTQALTRELPKGTRGCTISYDGTQKIAGQSIITNVACK
ncbi:hypothetical protein GCM10007301_24860 [Azorhizobium oxalatiphilum]|uniref:Uncharacterized protein n=1 Tax=Azorhizobium oxalatiphilum TaxID=980631 RepID=A0A917BYV3_9HYPH|nr:STY0301 family protein [Azorhizobium oxalatiphilum]GGF64055.1 hypothetical protein GCM10007301_24860 [Azorhizobium oxalatiphilum]